MIFHIYAAVLTVDTVLKDVSFKNAGVSMGIIVGGNPAYPPQKSPNHAQMPVDVHVTREERNRR